MRARVRRAVTWLTAGDRWVGFAMLALVAYYVVQRGVFQGKASGDGWFGFQYLRGIVFFHTIDMRAPLPEFLQFFGLTGPARHMPNRCPFGPVFVWMPFYLVANAVQGLLSLLHLTKPGNGQSPFIIFFTGFGTLGGVLVGWRYSYLLVERYCGRVAARIGTIAAVWATPIAWYAVTQAFYQHGLAFCFVAVLVEHWDKTRGDPSWKRMARLGVIGGFAMMMRPQEALWLLLPGVEAAWHVVRGPARGRWLVGGAVLTATALLAFVPQLLVWHYYTGSYFTPAQVEPFRPTTPFMLVSLFSTRAGLFPWSPICYLAVIGLAFWRRARVPALAMLAVFAIEVYVVSSAWVVTGGYGFGARRLSDGATLFALGVGLAWARAESALHARLWRRCVAGFVGFCVVLNVVAMELLRFRVIASSGAYARSAERFLTDMHAPKPLARLFGVIGYPFVQPVGWIFALWHRAPASAFEGIVGNWFLDRDGQWMQLQQKGTAFDDSTRAYAVEGLSIASPGGPATVKGPVRLLLPMFAKEPIVVHLVGTIPTATWTARWNGVEVPVSEDPRGLRIQVPDSAVEAGVNELELTLPTGATLQRIDFESISEWWRRTPKR
ncbi:MAG: hypothetical protein JWN44_3125 [Myxococcales bacterium]|nr:hypothetical protein [Myxococcales bacterium]